MRDIVFLIRPHQWAKNVFVFLPLFFSKHIMEWEYIVQCMIAFIAFCLLASAVYCFNDIHDVEADRKHPVKCKRPIASGSVSVTMGYLVMSICIMASFSLLLIVRYINSIEKVIFLLVAYLIINIAYCLWLKQKSIIDVFVIAVGFVLRVMVGGYATKIWLSEWIILMTFLLSLFLAFAKRRDDVVIFERTGIMSRKNTVRYNLEFMNSTLCVVASITMVCYILYTVSPEVTQRMDSNYLYLTSIFVLAGVIRYLQLVFVDNKSGSPTKVLMTDRFIQFCIIAWGMMFFVLLYVI